MSARSPEIPHLRFVEVDGLRVRTSVRGAGPPVLLVGGLGAPLELGEPFERALAARGFLVVSFDAPGVGQSDPYRRPRRMRGIARTIEGVLDVLGYDRVDVFGVSLGGVVAQQFAHQSPRRVRRLVLAATGPGVGGVPGSPRVLALMATPRRYRDPDFFLRVAGRLYGGAARHSPAAVLPSSSARFLRPPHLAAYLNQIYAITGWTSVPWLPRLRQPTLVLAGDDDPIVPTINARILAHLIPDARLEILRGAGHLFILEDPDGIAARVAAFLSAPR